MRTRARHDVDRTYSRRFKGHTVKFRPLKSMLGQLGK